MVRTQIYLTPDEKRGLASLAARKGRRQSELIRDAVDRLLAEQGDRACAQAIDELAGLWADRDDLPDFRRLRDEWDRESGR